MLHVTFTGSGAGFLRRGLRELGLRDRVLAFPDDLSFGPIDPPDPDLRSAWAAANLGPQDDTLNAAEKLPPMPPFMGGWRSPTEEMEEFWSVALSSKNCTVWFTRRVPQEYCGFLAWVERAGEKIYNVVDVTDARTVAERRLIFSIALVDPRDLDYANLIAGAAPLAPQVRDAYIRQWNVLRKENAALRVAMRAELVSAPISFFDDLLLSYVRKNWRKANWIAGEAGAAMWDEHTRQGNLEVLMARLFALLQTGSIEAKGELSEWWRSVEIKLADGQP